MKIKEAIEIINGTTSTVSVKESNDVLKISSKNTAIYGDWFLKMPMNAISWESIRKEWGGLSPDIKAIDLARVMDVIQQLLDTPVKERFMPYVLTTGTGDEKVYFKLEVMNSGKTVMVVTSKPVVYRDFILKFYEDTDSELKKLINLTKEVTREGLFDED